MTSSPSSYPFTPVVSSKSWIYDVFISFRGEDRKTFVDRLYAALVQQGIFVYKDDGELIRGESIPPSLMKVIEESTIVVIIFSENYVNSTWCLNELAHIMKCKDTQGKMVLPIFYGVDPSVLRKQKWRYNEAFAKHELKEKTTVEDWKKALVDASQISGYIVDDGDEAKVIKDSVDSISEWLRSATSSVNNNLIGIEPRMQDLKSKLQINSGGVRMIGIWGVGGGGKTTLASCIYDEISKMFDGCSFVSNVREESRKYGEVRLQEKILSDVTKKQQKVRGVEVGKHMLMAELRHRKVLIVLDDVDRLDQLEALVGSPDWFGEGSRIIITTRDRHLLHAHSVDMTHEITLLNNDEAFALFCKYAWSSFEPMEDYDQLSEEMVSYASGLPLAIKVLGCFLSGRNINEWKSALAKLKHMGHNDIFGRLEISFDGLEASEKDLFLDIACFFRWENKDRAMEILDACGFYPRIGVQVLMQKSLMTISDGKFDMHKLVQDMAHHIVRREHPRNPERHTRVWKKEDVQRLSTMDATEELDMVEAIRFKCNKADSLRGLPLIVANMKNLRWLEWEGDPPSPLPTNFPSRELRYLKLDGILQKQLWEGNKYLPHLKIMELCGLRNLMTTPNFTEIPNLERFKLTGSWYLEEIHPSIGKLKKLLLLSIKDCFSFKMFPLIMGLTNIQTITFSRCPNLFKLPEIPEKKMEKVENLLSNTSGIRKEIEPRKKSSKNFFVIWLTCGSNNLPTDTEVKNPQAELADVEEQILKKPCLPNSNMNLPNSNMNWFRLPYNGLRELDLSYCDLGDEYMAYAGLKLSDLRKLNLSGNKFSRLDFSFFQLPQLKWLNISYCKRLVELSKLPSSIAVLIADDCTSLHTFGDVPKCKWLWNVSHRRGNKLGNCYELILSMLEGNAVEDHFISVALELHNPEGFVGRLFSGTTFTLHLPDDWYNDFCGFLMCIVTDLKNPNVNIVVKKEEDKDSLFENWQESDEARDEAHKYDGTTTFVGYVSFNKLRDIVLLTSSFNTISFSIDREEKYQSSLVRESYVGVELIKRRSKGDRGQTTAGCYFEDGNTFTIQHDSKSSINVLWKPCDHQESMIEIKRPNDID